MDIHTNITLKKTPGCQDVGEGGEGGRIQKKVKRTWERATVKEIRTSEGKGKNWIYKEEE